MIARRRQITGDLSGWLVSRIDRTVNGRRRLLIDAKLREEPVNNRHIKKRERDQKNRYPAAQAAQSHQILTRL
jgi:hypothetical protein